ncbi:MAG: hypothetical protein Q7R56_03445 [Nanoarchaeota archaeon]|nr:hypothetical protein [Nanoarchaeota archaeon]
MNNQLRTIAAGAATLSIATGIGLASIGAKKTLERITTMQYTGTDKMSDTIINTTQCIGYATTIMALGATLATGILGYKVLRDWRNNHEY